MRGPKQKSEDSESIAPTQKISQASQEDARVLNVD